MADDHAIDSENDAAEDENDAVQPSNYERARALREQYDLDGAYAFGPDGNLLGQREVGVLRRLDRYEDEIRETDDATHAKQAKAEYVHLARKLDVLPELDADADDRDADNDDPDAIIEIPIDKLESILQINSVRSADDRVLAISRTIEGRVEPKFRLAFTGSKHYANPETAPVHLPPEKLVPDDRRTYPPTRGELKADLEDDSWFDPDDEEQVEEEYEITLQVWRDDVLRPIEERIELDGKVIDVIVVDD